MVVFAAASYWDVPSSAMYHVVFDDDNVVVAAFENGLEYYLQVRIRREVKIS